VIVVWLLMFEANPTLGPKRQKTSHTPGSHFKTVTTATCWQRRELQNPNFLKNKIKKIILFRFVLFFFSPTNNNYFILLFYGILIMNEIVYFA
jgi:hypothetical protein